MGEICDGLSRLSFLLLSSLFSSLLPHFSVGSKAAGNQEKEHEPPNDGVGTNWGVQEGAGEWWECRPGRIVRERWGAI